MLELVAPVDTPLQIVSSLDAVTQAYAIGDRPLGERLFGQALDEGLPWDQVCTAAAQGTAQWYAERDRV